MTSIMRKFACLFLGIFYALCGVWGGHASEKIILTGENFFPEGIANDGHGGVYVGSLTTGQILHIDLKSGQSTVFVDKKDVPEILSIVGLIVDHNRGILYACSTDAGVAEFKGEKITSLMAFDMKKINKYIQYPLPGGGFCNDMTMGSDGNIYITDTYNPRILLLRPMADKLDVWIENEMFGGEGINLNGIAWSDNQLFVVKSNSGELFRITFDKINTNIKVSRINTPRLLEFPDGLELLSANQLLVVEGSGKLTKIDISDDKATFTVIADDLDVPTTVEVVDGKAIVVQAQLDHLFDPVKAGRPSPFELKIITLQ